MKYAEHPKRPLVLLNVAHPGTSERGLPMQAVEEKQASNKTYDKNHKPKDNNLISFLFVISIKQSAHWHTRLSPHTHTKLIIITISLCWSIYWVNNSTLCVRQCALFLCEILSHYSCLIFHFRKINNALWNNRITLFFEFGGKITTNTLPLFVFAFSTLHTFALHYNSIKLSSVHYQDLAIVAFCSIHAILILFECGLKSLSSGKSTYSNLFWLIIKMLSLLALCFHITYRCRCIIRWGTATFLSQKVKTIEE